MHVRRLITFLLGAWLLGSLFMTAVAVQNFKMADRILAAPPAGGREPIQAMGTDARMVLRYQASELNRLYFANWEWAQLVLAVAVLAALLLGSNCPRWMLLAAFVALAIVGVMRFWITPSVTELGRTIDFVMPSVQTPERDAFWRFHNAYSSLEVLKWALLGGLTGRMLLSRRSRDARASFRSLEYADSARE